MSATSSPLAGLQEHTTGSQEARLISGYFGRNEMEKYREFSSFRKCARCELLAWCRGCPAVAASPDGDFYAPDPQCWREL